MPEGPEIRRAADQIAQAIGGRVAQRVVFGLAPLRRHERQLAGRRVHEVTSRGKAMLIHFEGGRTLYSHNQLYGRWEIASAGARPQATRSLRVAIDTARASALLYSASDIEVLATGQVGRHPYIARLGVELLAAETTLEAVRAQLDRPRFQRRALGALLLDQGFLAGVGNYLRSEILFVAGLHPELRLAQLDDEARNRLAAAALDLTLQSWRTGGITNDPGRAAALARQGVPYARFRHHVFDRDGEPCYHCGSRIRREQSAGRGLYRCPRCQPAPRRRAGLRAG